MTTHHFTPTHYHVTIGSHEPVLRIADGDTVITTTVDAGGQDARMQRVTPGGNPQTGPFFVEAASVGDTLVVHLDRITPNREIGYSGQVVAANVVDPFYVRELPPPPPGEGAQWRMDRERWTATLISPETKLGPFTLPLDPMIGCFGVAPAHCEAISTATSGRHGGNMEYRGFRAGATVFFPVFVEVGQQCARRDILVDERVGMAFGKRHAAGQRLAEEERVGSIECVAIPPIDAKTPNDDVVLDRFAGRKVIELPIVAG